jgi:hypothetical protein
VGGLFLDEPLVLAVRALGVFFRFAGDLDRSTATLAGSIS